MPDKELAHRLELWAEVKGQGGPSRIPASRIRDLKIYAGQAGIWRDKKRLGDLSPDGVTMSVLHTGRHYPDDLADTAILYHYPRTQRAPSQDQGEIDATKAARALGLPVFVITELEDDPQLRDVHLGWVDAWDDSEELFLITFGETPPSDASTEEDPESEQFDPVDRKRKKSRSHQAVRPGQARFQFGVFKRYGRRCALCGLDVPELIEAAHIVPWGKSGSDDARNGLPLCRNHHAALESALVRIDPETTELSFRAGGPSADALGVMVTSLSHMSCTPHVKALAWLWKATT